MDYPTSVGISKIQSKIDARNNGGDTAVKLASDFGRTDTVILLIQRGADINIENDSRLSPIASAFMNNHTEVVEVLRQAGAIQVPQSNPPLHALDHQRNQTNTDTHLNRPLMDPARCLFLERSKLPEGCTSSLGVFNPSLIPSISEK